MAMGAWRISRARVLTRRSTAIEALGSATVLCTDKTGTLTENRMSVAELRTPEGKWRRGDVGPAGQSFHEVVAYGVLASAPEAFDPMERALRELAGTAFASIERFPDVKVVAEWPDVALPPLGIDHYTAFVALTHDPKIDDPALQHALARDCFYIGALGSKKTHAKRVDRLKQAGLGEADIARIHAPIGLDIDAVSPAEIAVAIMGEITRVLRQKAEAA